MTLDDAMKHAKEKWLELKGTKCGDEHKQLYVWLKELKKLKKLNK